MKTNKKKIITTLITGMMLCSAVVVPTAQGESVLTNIGIVQTVDASAVSVTSYKQSDSRWGSYSYGYQDKSCTKKATISTSGCGLVALTNAVANLNGTFINPTIIADYSLKNGYRVNGVGTAYGLYSSFCSSYGSKYGIKYVGYTSSWDKLTSYLQSGNVSIVRKSGHIMCVVGYDSSSKKYLLVDSSWSSARGTSNGYAWKTKAELQKIGITSDFYVISSTKKTTNNTTSTSNNSSSSNNSTSVSSITPTLMQVSTSSSNLTVRKGAGTSYSKVTSLPKGTYIVATKRSSNGWYQINYKGTVGWVSGSYVKTVSASRYTVSTNSSNLNMRKTASTSASKVTSIPKGSTVFVIKTSGNWAYGVYNGYVGWMSLTYLKKQ